MGEKDDCALYIITKGEVELIYEGLKLNEKVKKNILKTYG
jgi:potassium voltage-gated channel Eag-related subfamily H protein 7